MRWRTIICSAGTAAMANRFGYLLAFVLPTASCALLLAGPQPAASALLWTLPFWLLLWLDWRGPPVSGQSQDAAPAGYYDALLYALVCLQCANIVLMLAFVAKLPWQTPADFGTGLVNLLLVRFLVGSSSGTSGIVVAHELIHREAKLQRALGHLLLYTVCYDHFVIAHQRGHHDHLGLPEDIATARFGESFSAYWRRVCRGYFSYAWRAESERLGIGASLWQVRQLQNQVLHGLAIELAILLAALACFGWLAAAMFLYQAFAAARILEAVNYFQHWGLDDARARHSYGWVTASWLSRHALIGLSNHIGHHQNAARRYYEIPYSARGPKLPYGYFVMNLWVKLHNASYRKMAERALLDFQ